MSTLFGTKVPTSKHLLRKMTYPTRCVGIRFINKMVNLKHSSSYISKVVMGLVMDVEDGHMVDWAKVLTRNLVREL